VKNVYEVKEIQRLYQEKGSIKEVVRVTSISRNTVRKYLRRIEKAKTGKIEEVVKRKPTVFKRRTITEEIVNKIISLLEENKSKPANLQFTAKKIWHMVTEKGHSISYTSVKRIVRKWKEENGLRKVFIAQQPDGKRAEFDWGYVELIINREKKKYPAAYMVLNKSLYRYSKVFERESSLEVVQAHIDFFNQIGGVPPQIYYDNMKVVKDRKNLNKNFVKFATFYGFSPKVCNPYSPQEKGTDEESVGYVRNWVFSERNEFNSLKEANEYLKQSMKKINNSPVSKRKDIPVEGIKEEKLNRLPSSSYNNYTFEERAISRYSLISLDNNSYSVPEDYPGRRIKLKVYTDHIEMLRENNIVATHKRLGGKNKYSIKIEHYLDTLRKKPGALAHSRAFQALNKTLKTLYNRYYTTREREFIMLLQLFNEYKEKDVCEKIKKLFENGIIPTHDIMKNILEQKEIRQPGFEYSLNIHIDHGEPSIYDKLAGVYHG